MKSTPITSALFLASALAFFVLIAINAAQARSLPAERFSLKVARIATYGRRAAPPPPPPPPPPQTLLSSPKSKEFTSNYEKLALQLEKMTSSDEGTLSSSPKLASPKGQHEIESPYTEENPCNDGCISMITDFWRPITPSPRLSAPQHASPTIQTVLDLEQILHQRSPPRLIVSA